MSFKEYECAGTFPSKEAWDIITLWREEIMTVAKKVIDNNPTLG